MRVEVAVSLVWSDCCDDVGVQVGMQEELRAEDRLAGGSLCLDLDTEDPFKVRWDLGLVKIGGGLGFGAENG